MSKLKLLLSTSKFRIIVVLVAVLILVYLYKMNSVYKENAQLYKAQYDGLYSLQHDLLEMVEHNSEQIRVNLVKQNTIRNKMDIQRRDYTNALNDINKKFNYTITGVKRDLEVLALKKPVLIEGIINNASNEIGKELEIISNNDPRTIGVRPTTN